MMAAGIRKGAMEVGELQLFQFTNLNWFFHSFSQILLTFFLEDHFCLRFRMDRPDISMCT